MKIRTQTKRAAKRTAKTILAKPIAPRLQKRLIQTIEETALALDKLDPKTLAPFSVELDKDVARYWREMAKRVAQRLGVRLWAAESAILECGCKLVLGSRR